MELGVSTSAEPGDDGERVPLTPSRGGGDGGWDSALPGLAATEADTKKARNKAKLQRFAAAASFADGGDDEEDSGRRYDDPTQAPPVGDARGPGGGRAQITATAVRDFRKFHDRRAHDARHGHPPRR